MDKEMTTKVNVSAVYTIGAIAFIVCVVSFIVGVAIGRGSVTTLKSISNVQTSEPAIGQEWVTKPSYYDEDIKIVDSIKCDVVFYHLKGWKFTAIQKGWKFTAIQTLDKFRLTNIPLK